MTTSYSGISNNSRNSVPRRGKIRLSVSSKASSLYGDDTNRYSYDTQEMQQVLEKLYLVKDEQIRKLASEHQNRMDYVIAHVKVLYAANDDYPVFYNQVQSVFGHLKQVQVGTVSAYFVGCMLSNAGTNKGCSVLCAGALPPPKQNDGTDAISCGYSVLLAISLNNAYTFTYLSGHKTKEEVIIYILNNTNDKEFKFNGFSKQEVTILSSWNIKRVKLVQTNNLGTDTIQITNDAFVDLKSIPLYEQSVTESSSSSLSEEEIVAIVLIVIFALIIIGLICYRYVSGKFPF
jgi:hypothetical protein